MGRIRRRSVELANEWIEVVRKEVDLGPPRGIEEFWSVRTASEYVVALALTTDGRIPLVRQFRPAVEAWTLELPSGAIDPGETPEAAARRELAEETGCVAGELVALGETFTDTGRMETRQWGFFAPAARVESAPGGGDEQLELRFVSPSELRRLVAGGELRIGVHLGVIAAAVARGVLELR